ncbi:MAG TPA: hypothetical protein PLJ12_07920, partial [Planctomycetota bacterium]|nr:hypothetical protein [Planctomycetota bacterium]
MKPLQITTAAALVLATGTSAIAQRTVFSIDWHSPTVGLPDPGGVPITAGDLLGPTAGMTMLGPLGIPTIVL